MSTRRTSSAPSWCSGCITTSSRCSSPAACSPATRSCCAAAVCCGPARARLRARPVTPWSEPDFAVATATGLVALCGAMLLMLGVLAPSTDYSWLDPEFADIAFQAGQYIPSLIGAGLIIMALALSHRVNLAWSLTILLLLGGAGIRRDAGQPVVGHRGAGAERRAAGAVPLLLLSPRLLAERSVRGLDGDCRCSCW